MDYVTAWKEREKEDTEKRLKLFHEARRASEHAARILADEFGAEQVYLFGSLLEEDNFSIHSDIDIAVDGLKVELYFKALNHLWEILPKGVSLDLAPIEDADETLKAIILHPGLFSMKNSLHILKTEIEEEMKGLDRLEYEMTEVLNHPKPSFLETRAAGSILHDFYTRIEKIFRRIASRIDRDLPTSDDWHTDLLKRMTMSLDGIRPSVIDEGLKEHLGEYLRFRHLFRNIYGFELKWKRCATLGKEMSSILKLFKNKIQNLLNFIDSIK